MYHFAHPSYCPQCRAMRTGQPRWQRCGLVLVGADADRLYGLLAQADAELDRLRELLHSPDPAAPPPAEGPAEPMAPPAADQPARRPRRITTGSVLLALGALLLVVAGVVFVAVTWGNLPQSARILLLLSVTFAVGAASLWCVWRTLRASSEALWGVAVALLMVDLTAAHETGLLGLDRLSERGFLALVAVLLAVPSAVAGLLTRSRWSRRGGDGRPALVVAELSVVGGALAAVATLAAGWESGSAWLAIFAMVLLASAALGAGLLRLRLAMRGIVAAAVLAYGGAVLAAIDNVLVEPSVSEMVRGSAWPMLVMLGVSAVAAAIAPRVAAPAALVASGLAAALFVVPAEAAGRLPLTLTASAVVVALALAGMLRLGTRMDGVRLAAALGAAALLATLAMRAQLAGAAVAAAATPVWSVEIGVRLAGVRVPADEHAWFSLVLGAALATTALVARHWPTVERPGERRDAFRQLLVAAAGLLTVGGVVVMLLWPPTPVWVLTATAVLAAVAVATATRTAVLVAASAVLVMGAVVSAGSAGLSAMVLAAAAAALLVQAVSHGLDLLAVPLAGVGVVVAELAVLAATHELGGTSNTATLVVVVAGMLTALGVATAAVVWGGRDGWLLPRSVPSWPWPSGCCRRSASPVTSGPAPPR